MPESKSPLSRIEEEHQQLSPIIRAGLLYGALTGAVVALCGGFTLNLVSSKFRMMPAGLKTLVASGCVIGCAIAEQDKRVKQHVFLRQWDRALGGSGACTETYSGIEEHPPLRN
ncbi:hypothetical protein V1525DRAFT_424391 [Lipomyces kononenkoae]|uniref:Uncharacterized protein n=1 Tax=Lipomyces kononenkoae TaxID=34357 RepID=A0ACC3T7L8_LIPKO